MFKGYLATESHGNTLKVRYTAERCNEENPKQIRELKLISSKFQHNE